MRRWSSVSEVLHALLVITVVAAAPLRCKNQHQPDSDCDRWASSGECEANAGFMKQQCAASCKSCGWKDTRCTDRSHLRPAKSNGQITATFERALTFTEYSPTVHSRPPHGPWVVTFDNFGNFLLSLRREAGIDAAQARHPYATSSAFSNPSTQRKQRNARK